MLVVFDKKVVMGHDPGPATLRATAIAYTVVETAVVVAAAYHMWQGNAIALAVFSLLAVVGVFVVASAWGTDLDRRHEPVPVPPREIHELAESDFAKLMHMSNTKKLVVTLRTQLPYVTIEAVNNGYAGDWLVEGESLFEAYVKAWMQVYGDGDTNELAY